MMDAFHKRHFESAIEMELTGIRDLIAFLNHLRDSSISYTLAHDRADSVMVCYTLVGARIELDFFDDHIEYSVFTGDESVLEDQEKLFPMINHWRDSD